MFRITRTPHIIRMIFRRMTWGFSLQEAAVYLTFDDGPDPELTAWVLDMLNEYNAKATFFCVGERVCRHPETFQRILNEGHAVGNHTMNHENGWKTADEAYIRSVEKAASLISSRLFRPPYGRIKRSQVTRLTSAGYRIIMWSWLTYDFDKSLATEKILKKTSDLKAGDIVVLHDNPKCGERLKSILPSLLDELKKKGLACKAIE